MRVGQTEQALGQIEREYIRRAHDAMIGKSLINQGFGLFVWLDFGGSFPNPNLTISGPLQRFLDGEMKNISRERKILENKRLDLDSCKNKVRKARAMQLQPVVRKKHQASYIVKQNVFKTIKSNAWIHYFHYPTLVCRKRALIRGLY